MNALREAVSCGVTCLQTSLALPHSQGEPVSVTEAKEEGGVGCKSIALSKTPLRLPGRVKKPGKGGRGEKEGSLFQFLQCEATTFCTSLAKNDSTEGGALGRRRELSPRDAPSSNRNLHPAP